jgi:HEPN domain-containing protein
MPHDELRAGEVKAWFAKALSDLRAAEHNLAAHPPLLEDSLFHCQQAAEKTLKAFLTWHDRPFRKTHDLNELGFQCVQIDASLEQICRRAARLSTYAWIFRYPGQPGEPTRDEVVTALSLARELLKEVKARLPKD